MILALAGCGGGNEPSPEWSSERMGRSNPFDIPEDYDRSEKKSSHTSSYLVPMTIEQLIERSVLVMRGRVLGFDYLTIQYADGGSTAVHTDYYVEVLEVLRGEPYNKDQVIVRAEGGEDEERIDINSDLSLNTSEEYIFFLCTPSVGGGAFYTDGDYYSIIYVNSGLFKTSGETAKKAGEASAPAKVSPYYSSADVKGEMDYEEFCAIVEEYSSEIPIDEEFFVKEALSGLQKNLESGFITQQEYDDAVKRIGLGSHATVVGYYRP